MKFRYYADNNLYSYEEAEKITRQNVQRMIDEKDDDYMEYLSERMDDCPYSLVEAIRSGDWSDIIETVEELTESYRECAEEWRFEDDFTEVEVEYTYCLDNKEYSEEETMDISAREVYGNIFRGGDDFVKWLAETKIGEDIASELLNGYLKDDMAFYSLALNELINQYTEEASKDFFTDNFKKIQ